MHGSGGPEFNHFWLDVTKTSKTSITSGFCTDVTLDVHFQGATLARGRTYTQRAVMHVIWVSKI